MSISNYALIEKSVLTFENGLTCITGEPGAGKSILLDALGLVLGDRADSRLCFDKSNKSVIEATFDVQKLDLQDFFQANDLDYDDVCIIRRELTASKSRCFVNDTPVNLQVLKTLGSKLLDLQTQYQKFSLSDGNKQLAFLDDFMDNASIVEDYSQCYQRYTSLLNELNELQQQLDKQMLEKDFNLFVLNELQDAALVAGEYESLENEMERLTNSEFIREKLSLAVFAMSENEQMNVKSGCHEVHSLVSNVARYIDNGEELSQRLNSVYIEVKDIANELAAALDAVESNPQRLEQCNERLDLLNTLLRKHKVNTVEDLISIRESLSGEIYDLDSKQNRINNLNKDLEKIQSELRKKADILSQQRGIAAKMLSDLVTKEMNEYTASNNVFVVQMSHRESVTPTGCDAVDFLFSANVGVAPSHVFDVASGGELSRIMLALKSAIASKNSVPTLIFDEIDSGISGVTASVVAQKLKKLSAEIQIIAITHLPQIAAKADYQYQVYKESSDMRSYSKVALLTGEERVNALALMISGTTLNENAINNAKFLLNENN